jgi:hypothetical protein
MTRRPVLAAFAALALSAGLPSSLAAQAPRPPRLIVLLVVDQLRTDYFERHRDQLTGGLRRIVDEGAVLRERRLPVPEHRHVRGHATIGTGALPFRHGMVLNAWYDRATRAPTGCADDPTVKNDQLSRPRRRALQRAPAARADARRPAPRAGPRPGRVAVAQGPVRHRDGRPGRRRGVWFDERGGFATSTAYTRRPVGFMQRFFEQNPITADYGRTWERLLEPAAYTGADDVEFERPPSGWTRTFPHRLETPDGKPTGAFYAQWARSPFADEYLARMAAHASTA